MSHRSRWIPKFQLEQSFLRALAHRKLKRLFAPVIIQRVLALAERSTDPLASKKTGDALCESSNSQIFFGAEVC